ncbi:MAG TPA: Ppx/GppA family phosphatase [Hypericibacter adhaerens]|uniref:Exopolyphosphatase n=1 Tax=Hypericibacter adhaerens TaxID=2602016 RepID=A0A5J6MZX3_9PROT|nr:Ppx/GppA family phosphatase [Hypericibacter adhaerens]QEX23129.1 exopolyphosphatase [Hypericibacter adhaerens]HWA45027.1 Ppx/GppA family phosphatase [Hypericibacter adhaerens]
MAESGAGKTRSPRIGVVDIGSNSIRLVVFDRLSRAPWPIFNEKVLCGLGRGLEASGELNKNGVAMAIGNLERFVRLADGMDVGHLDMVATAAVRDAANGAEFVAEAERRCQRKIRIISGEEEARLSALGVASGMPDTSGIMGDLGGGSLELVRLTRGEPGRHVTLPIGPLRLMDIADGDRDKARKAVDQHLEKLDWLAEAKGGEFFPVGGAWRTLARIHMEQVRYPLHVIHAYTISRRAAEEMARVISRLGRRSLASIRGVPRRRLDSLPLAALVLERVLRLARPDSVNFSAYGLREGLIFDRLSPAEQRKDPLYEAARDLALLEGRFGSQGARLKAWLTPIFDGKETASEARLRLAVCELSDIAWREHPDYRAEQAFMRILRLPIGGLDHHERVFAAVAIAQRYGFENELPGMDSMLRLLSDQARRDAEILGLGLRLAYSLAAAPALLDRTALARSGSRLTLNLPKGEEAMFGEAVQRRLEALGRALDLPIGTATLTSRRAG